MLFIPEASLPHSWHGFDDLFLAQLGTKSIFIPILRGFLQANLTALRIVLSLSLVQEIQE